MGDSFGSGSGIPDDEDELRPRIGRLNSSNTPPLTLRGVGTPSSAPQNPALATRKLGDETEANRLQTTGSGISQIKNPIGRGILRGLETAGGIGESTGLLPPHLMSRVPGTTEHNQALQTRARGRIGEDVAQEKDEAQTGALGAQTEHAQAETSAIPSTIAHTEAETNALQHPQVKPKEEKWTPYKDFTGSNGEPLEIEENSGRVQLVGGGAPTGFKASKPEQPFQTDKTVRIINGVPHEVLIDKQTGADVKDLGQTKVPGESSGDKRKANESAQVEREARVNIRKAEGQYRDTQKSVGQLTASIDAARDGNGLLTSFVPTMEVLGINAANGVHRISPAEAQAANLPGGWAEQFNAWFDKTSTGQISPQLVTEGKTLARILLDSSYQRYKSTYDDESGIVTGYGGTGFDKRVPLAPHQGTDSSTQQVEPQRPANVPQGYVFQENGPKGRGWYRPQ